MSSAEQLNRRASSRKSRPDEVIRALRLREGGTIADIGSGGGYFVFRFAEAVGPSGKVYAIDANPEFLSHIEKIVAEKGYTNIATVHSEDDSFTLPEGCLDLIFMRNVSHHLKRRTEYFSKLRRLLKRGGRVAIIEYEPGGRFSLRRMSGHYVQKESIIREMSDAGFKLLESLDLLPEQSFTIFEL
jgi:arsenite methyltransferase